MPLFAPKGTVPNVLIINDDPDAAGDLRALLQMEGVSAHVLTVDAFGTPDAAATWMLQLDPIAIVIDIVAAPGSECWPRLIGLQDPATRQARRWQSGHADEDWFLAEMDLRRGGGFTEEDRISSESARNEAEHVRRLAEDAREVRDRHRDALETVRQEEERVRNAGESARAAAEQARAVGEGARTVAEAARQAVLDAVRDTAHTLKANLEQMKVVEEMRRALRDMRDGNTLDSN